MYFMYFLFIFALLLFFVSLSFLEIDKTKKTTTERKKKIDGKQNEKKKTDL